MRLWVSTCAYCLASAVPRMLLAVGAHCQAVGSAVLPTLAEHLVKEYGSGFAEKNLRRMVQCAVTFPEKRIVVTLSRQLSWSHFLAILPLKDALQRDFYVQMASAERRSVRTLRDRIDSMLYERTALSRQPAAIIAQELATLQGAQPQSSLINPSALFGGFASTG